MKVAVNLENDLTFGFSLHNYAVPTLPAVASPLPAFEIIVPHKWEQGASKHALTSTVFHRGKTIAQDGHDAGQFIADEAGFLPALANGQYPMLLLSSARKVAFSASTVFMNGKPTGAAEKWSLPLMTCGTPASFPSCWPVHSHTNTVHVGLTGGDVTFGWIGVYVSVFTDCVFYALSIASPTKEIGDALKEFIGFDWEKPLVNTATGFLLSLGRSYENDWRTPISLKLELTAFGGSNAVELSYDPKTRQIKLTDTIGAGSKKAEGGAVYDVESGTWKTVKDQNVIDPDDVWKAASDPSLLTT